MKHILFRLLAVLMLLGAIFGCAGPTASAAPSGPEAGPTLVYLPLATRTPLPPGSLVQPADFTYLGAFRLPGAENPPQTFAYGGNAMTFNPDGDPANSDSLPGSLFIMGHDRQAYNTLPDGSQIAEIAIPAPLISRNIEDLPYAVFLQDFANPTAGFFTELEEIPHIAMQYLNHPLTGPKIHLTWAQHLQEDILPSLIWFNPNLAGPQTQGAWQLGEQHPYSAAGGYMFEIPAAWADAETGGRYLAVGRSRDGGQGGYGPALFAYTPWLSAGSAPAAGSLLSEETLLLYATAYYTDTITRNMERWQAPDVFVGGAWLTTASGKTGVLFAGTKSNGTRYWYGFIDPRGPEYVCPQQESIEEFIACRQADGSPCPPEEMLECAGHTSERGWWSTHFDAEFLLYNPADLAQVANGSLQAWRPQPYAWLDVDEYLYLNPPVWDIPSVGEGVQRRNRVNSLAYDRQNGLLYLLENLADGGKPVVHVWKVK